MSRKKNQKKTEYESQKPVFYIPQFIKIEGLRSTYKFVGSTPISPIFGRHTKNILAPENVIVKEVDVDQRYDSYRDPEDKKTKDYDKFKEFKDVIITADDHEKYLGTKIHKQDEETLKSIEKQNEPQIIKPIGFDIKTLEKADKEEIKLDFKNFNQSSAKEDIKEEVNNQYQESEILIPSKQNEESSPYISPIPIENDSLNPEIMEPTFLDPSSYVEVEEIKKPKEKPTPTEIRKKDYQLPSVNLFSKQDLSLNDKPEWLLNQIDIINETLAQFNVDGKVAGSKKGPTVTRYEIELGHGVNVKKVSSDRKSVV